MDDALKQILKKLDNIEDRVRKMEGNTSKPGERQRDSLFEKATHVILNYDEVSTSKLQKLLGIDVKRAEHILDQLEKAGYGQCYMGEA